MKEEEFIYKNCLVIFTGSGTYKLLPNKGSLLPIFLNGTWERVYTFDAVEAYLKDWGYFQGASLKYLYRDMLSDEFEG
jgi:hypothetical protein